MLIVSAGERGSTTPLAFEGGVMDLIYQSTLAALVVPIPSGRPE